MTPYPLHRSETSTKMMITLFLLFMIGSFTVALLNVYDKVGRVPDGVVQRYGPDDATAHNAAPTAVSDGLYGSVDGQNVAEQRAFVVRMNTFSTLIDLTHPHIFEMPIVILVLCHFLMRTRLASWAKAVIYILSFGGVAGMLATPWLVRYASIKFAPMLIVSAFAIGIAALPLILVPILDMWIPPSKDRSPKV